MEIMKNLMIGDTHRAFMQRNFISFECPKPKKIPDKFNPITMSWVMNWFSLEREFHEACRNTRPAISNPLSGLLSFDNIKAISSRGNGVKI